MHPAAVQSSEGPVLRMQGYAFQRILVVDKVNSSQDVMFITATREGEELNTSTAS